ncbi:hypothetical protein GCM10023220_16860 [Streptomyces ziwulingensis]|uniref:Uncharacterized protein n=1 Tax=Streptomyces ziwulingensis TaxID=1045501 RepID=A0ABP9BBM0_9ACTN
MPAVPVPARDGSREAVAPSDRPPPEAPWGVVPGGDRVGVAHSYLTPARPWQTIWRTLANPGE